LLRGLLRGHVVNGEFSDAAFSLHAGERGSQLLLALGLLRVTARDVGAAVLRI
jgi:hypothetical protein